MLAENSGGQHGVNHGQHSGSADDGHQNEDNHQDGSMGDSGYDHGDNSHESPLKYGQHDDGPDSGYESDASGDYNNQHSGGGFDHTGSDSGDDYSSCDDSGAGDGYESEYRRHLTPTHGPQANESPSSMKEKRHTATVTTLVTVTRSAADMLPVDTKIGIVARPSDVKHHHQSSQPEIQSRIKRSDENPIEDFVPTNIECGKGYYQFRKDEILCSQYDRQHGTFDATASVNLDTAAGPAQVDSASGEDDGTAEDSPPDDGDEKSEDTDPEDECQGTAHKTLEELAYCSDGRLMSARPAEKDVVKSGSTSTTEIVSIETSTITAPAGFSPFGLISSYIHDELAKATSSGGSTVTVVTVYTSSTGTASESPTPSSSADSDLEDRGLWEDIQDGVHDVETWAKSIFTTVTDDAKTVWSDVKSTTTTSPSATASTSTSTVTVSFSTETA